MTPASSITINAKPATSGTPVQETTILEVSNGLRLRYRKSGNGPPLVLLHTIRTQLEYFGRIAPQLSEWFTVYAVDLPAHGYVTIDPDAIFDEPYFRAALVGFIEKLALTDVTLVGESIGGVLSLTVAATIPDKVRRVYAINTYDYETRYGDGIRRGNWFANFIIGSLQLPGLGLLLAKLENKVVLGKIMGGGYHDPSKLPDDLLSEFDRASHRPGYRAASRKVLAAWRSWGAARRMYSAVQSQVTLIYGDSDWSRPDERARTASLLTTPKVITLKDTGHFSALESPAALLQALLKD